MSARATGRLAGVSAAALVAVLAVLVPPGCSRTGSPADRDRIVVTTSWLECVVRDVAGDTVEAVRLCPPGSCPGHFDMRPSQMGAVRSSRLLLRFDFQKGLDEKVSAAGGGGPKIVSVTPGEGMCLPGNYLKACREVSEALCGANPDLRVACTRSLGEVERRMEALGAALRRRVADAGVAGAPVLASRHQAVFCRWLGLEVLETFGPDGADNPCELAGIIEATEGRRVAFVVANLQEGDRQAKALAGRFDARLVVFSNFPDMSGTQRTFDDLLRTNVRQLIEAAAE